MNTRTSLPFWISLSLFLFCQQASTAQEMSKMVKVYTNLQFGPDFTEIQPELSYSNSIWTEGKRFNFGYFSPALALTNSKGNRHEMEITRVTFSSRDRIIQASVDSISQEVILGGARQKAFLLALRYEYDQYLKPNDPEAKWRPYIGLSANPYFSYTSYSPSTSTQYFSSNSTAGIAFALVPRIEYRLKEKWCLDLNFPIHLAEISGTSERTDNPRLPDRQGVNSRIDFDAFDNVLWMRFGVGFKI